MIYSSSPPFPLGETMEGVDPNDSTKLVNQDHVGKIYLFDSRNAPTLQKAGRRSGQQIKCVCLRNVSGGILLPKRMALLDLTNAELMLEQVTGYATDADEHLAVAVDEFLHATNGVADDELFWGVVYGRTTLTTASSTTSIALGQALGVVSADGGRINGQSLAVTSVATAMAASSTDDADVIAHMHSPVFR